MGEKKKVYLLSPLSEVHAGTQASASSVLSSLTNHQVLDVHWGTEPSLQISALKACDILVVNAGEALAGNLLSAHFVMESIGLAQAMGKTVCMMNCLFRQSPPFCPAELAALDYFSVRDSKSLRLARSCGADPKLRGASCLDTHELSAHAEPLVSLSGVIKGDAGYDGSGAQVLEALPFPTFSLTQGDMAQCVATLRNAKAYVTGSAYGLYAAALAGIPCIPLASRNGEMESLIEQADCAVPLGYSGDEVEANLSQLARNAAPWVALNDYLTSVPLTGVEELEEAPKDTRAGKPLISQSGALLRNGECLRRVVGGRPVAMLLPGGSVRGLEGRTRTLVNNNACLAAVKKYPVIEQGILAPSDRHVDLLLVSMVAALETQGDEIAAFLERPEDNVFITSPAFEKIHPDLYARHSAKIAVYEFQLPPVNTLCLFLTILALAKTTDLIALFGADGMLLEGETVNLLDKERIRTTYYSHEKFGPDKTYDLIKDTYRFNRLTADILEEASRVAGAPLPRILNANPESCLDIFPKMGVEDVLAILNQ